MNEADGSALEDGECAPGLDQADWEPVGLPDPAAQGQASSSKGNTAKGDPAVDAYITSQVHKLRPRSSAQQTTATPGGLCLTQPCSQSTAAWPVTPVPGPVRACTWCTLPGT